MITIEDLRSTPKVNMRLSYSRTVVVLVFFLFCVITTSEAASLGDFCNGTITCDKTGEVCNASSMCGCNTGYGEYNGDCQLNSITVSLSGPDSSVIYGSSTSLTANITTSVGVTAVAWQKVGAGGSLTTLTVNSTKYTQTGDLGTGTAILTINNLEYTDEGSYQVQMTNSLGKTDTSNQVSVDVAGGPPSVSVTGLTQSDDSVTIGCNATVTSDSPAITAIKWTKGGADIAKSNGKYSGGNVTIPALTINSVDSGDAGVYRCVATNPAGSTTSDNDVTLARPTDVEVTGTPSVVHNSTATLTGSYTSVLPSVTITWQKQGTNKNDYTGIVIGSSDGKYAGSNVTGSSPKLVINYVNFTDKTSYRMVVNNGVGSVSSQPFALDVTGGSLTVTTGPNVTGRVGRNVTIVCTVAGPEINNIQWKKVAGTESPKDIDTNDPKYSGGTVSIPSLTINTLTPTDKGDYQCTASNPGGTYDSDSTATVTLRLGEFNEDCTVTEPCDNSSDLICKANGKCLCNTTHYHINKTCYPRIHLAPSISTISSTTSQFSVFWSHPSIDYDLVSGYIVSWRQNGDFKSQNKTVERGENTTIINNSDLISGQMYIVTVSAVVRLTNPEETITITSPEKDVRLDPLPPGAILHSESSFAHDNLTLKWTPPSNTFVTSYEVMIDGKIQSTGNNNPWLHFTMKSFTPGKYYVVSIVTISGILSDEKRSTAYKETIRITPSKPGPPINVSCPQHPKDISLEISWDPPTNPNGQIVTYQIHVNPGSPTGLIINTTNNMTNYNVMGLSEEKMYNFTVRTINDAAETQKASDPSEAINCSTKPGVSTPPLKLNISEIGSRGFKISFEKPVKVSGQLAGYRIAILEVTNCVQEIFLEGNCPSCKDLVDCPNPQFIQQPDINQPVVHQVIDLKPYIHYIVKVAAVNEIGEGRFNNATAKTEEETPQKPGNIRATHIEAKTLTLSWDVAGPSPGNTTYTVEVHEGTDDTGTNFIMKQPNLYTYGFHQKSLSIADLEEYWPYKFKVIAATIIGTSESDSSDIVRTKQAAPGQVANLTVNIKEGNYRVAYAYWNIPSLRERNGVLENYHFKITYKRTEILTGIIPVSLSTQRVEQNFTVEPEEIYTVSVFVTNNKSMAGQDAHLTYTIPSGRPPIDNNVELISTVPGQHKSSQQTITVELYTDFFRNDLNGKQVLFGITVCEESKCKDQGSLSTKEDWAGLPNWHDASKTGFPLYRVTNQTYMDEINNGGSRWKRSTSSEFTIGQDTSCSSKGSYVYCNGPLNSGQSYRVILFACTNGGCSHSVQYGPYSTIKIPERVDNSAGVIVGSIIGVIGVLVITIVVLVFVKRRNGKNQNDGNTYADLEFNERTKNEQVYLKLERGTKPEKTSIPVHQFVSHMEDVVRDSELKIYREFSNLLLSTGRESKRIGESKINLPRNRNIAVPYDFNRVKLLGKKGSRDDYINASVILEQHYIMTQYPLPKTIGHFWQMVWEQNAPSIVVLSDDDDEDSKGEQYFPVTDGAVLSLGGIDIELLATFNILERATLRKFRLSKNSFLRGKELKNVNHYHVYGLQMATLSEELLSCINLVKSNERGVNETGQLIVHGGCSGTDYSGVFITTDYLIKSIDSGAKDVDVYRTALSVMNERMSAINTEDQYSTIYICLQKYLVSKADVKTCYENSERKSAAGTYEYLP